VLVVEDNPDEAELLKRVIAREGYEARIADGVGDAFLLATDFRPQVAVIDLGLPNLLSGFELLVRLRAQPELAGCRFISITGDTSANVARHSIQAGFDAHLTKPVDAGVLLELLAAACQSAEA
jgi:CheY-like chemotaxis protein